MPKFFVSEEQINEKTGEIKIVGTDVNHLKNVLRIKKGEKIEICDAMHEQNYNCQIKEIQKDVIITSILEKLTTSSESNVKVTIFQGIPKAEKMEWIIQKAVELGVHEIVPVAMKRCVVKWKEKDKDKKIQRWQKISEVAAKQCGRNKIPTISTIIKSNEIR